MEKFHVASNKVDACVVVNGTMLITDRQRYAFTLASFLHGWSGLILTGFDVNRIGIVVYASNKYF